MSLMATGCNWNIYKTLRLVYRISGGENLQGGILDSIGILGGGIPTLRDFNAHLKHGPPVSMRCRFERYSILTVSEPPRKIKHEDDLHQTYHSQYHLIFVYVCMILYMFVYVCICLYVCIYIYTHITCCHVNSRPSALRGCVGDVSLLLPPSKSAYLARPEIKDFHEVMVI